MPLKDLYELFRLATVHYNRMSKDERDSHKGRLLYALVHHVHNELLQIDKAIGRWH